MYGSPAAVPWYGSMRGRSIAILALVVRFELKDSDAAASFDRLVEVTVDGIRQHEPGTLLYVIHTVVDEPLARVFYEVYQDRNAFEGHERQPHTVRFLEERSRYVAAMRIEILEPVMSKGLSDGRW